MLTSYLIEINAFTLRIILLSTIVGSIEGLLWRLVHKTSVIQIVHLAEHLNVMELSAEERDRLI